MTDAAGVKVWEIEAKPFGDVTIISGSATLNFRFQGQYYDGETGHHQNFHRDYKPEVGRYLSADPALSLSGNPNIPYLVGQQLDYPQAAHLFTYVGNNPVNYTDREGLVWPIDCVRCFYYMSKCAKEGLKCKEKKCKEKEDVESPELFNECFKKIPACQKQLKYCGKCALAPKGPSTPPNQ